MSRPHSRLVRDLGRLAQEDPQAYHEMALRTRSPDALDALAKLALSGSRSDSLLEIGRALATDLDTAALGSLAPDARWLSEFAATSALQVTRVTPDLLAARGLWAWAATVDPDQLTERHRDLRAQVAWTLRDELGEPAREEVASWVQETGLLSTPVRAELAADLVNPWLADPGVGAPSSWEERCQEILGPRLGALHVPAGDGAPYDRLTASAAGQAGGDRHVVVILTTYRPDRSLLTAVRSVIAQTWQAWTLLIVDDASGPDFDDILAEASALDERIRLIRRDVNGGTYQARNTALREVGTADFITFHDSDDWSHPQRLALTLEPLCSDPLLVATTAWGIKATDELALTRLGYRGTSRVAASLVVRRDPVLTRLGYFDPVRKSADKEFQRRIAAAFPERTAEVRDPTCVIRRGHESLSSADHSRGWRHHSRRHYLQAYQPWHRRIKRGEVDPFLDDAADRRFWAPRRWTAAGSRGARPEADRFDVVIAADFSHAATVEQLGPLLGRARRDGRRVGLLQLDGPVLLSGPEPPTAATIVRQVSRGQCDWVYLDDAVQVGLVIVPDAGALHPGAESPASWSAERVVLTVPAEEGVCDPRVAARRAEEVFGVAPSWWDAARDPWPPSPPAESG